MTIKNADKQWVDSWQMMDRQVPQADAEYNAIGMVPGEKACANCRWFIEPGACVLVRGDIAPTGLSKYWEQDVPHMMEPMPVTIVDGNSKEDTTEPAARSGGIKSALENAVARIAAIAGGSLRGPSSVRGEGLGGQAFSIKEMPDGRLRFFANFTNAFQDAEGEIFTTEGHKEFIAWADKHESYPELWIWHTPGTKYGQVDWLDISDGIVVASGLIDSGKEALAREIAADPDTGMSHGFLYAQKDNSDKTIDWYRTYEITTLPRRSAANKATGFIVLDEELEVAFSDAKKEHLRKVLNVDDATIAIMEKSSEEMSTNMKALGIAWKEEGEAESAASLESIDARISGLTSVVSALAAEVVTARDTAKAANDAVESAQKSLDDRVAEAFEAKVKSLPTGFQASQDSDNVVDGVKAEQAKDWFGPIIDNMARTAS